MTDEQDDTNNSKEETWENLTKDYLTTDQKLAIIREYNNIISTTEWYKTVAAMRDYVEKNVK